MQTVSSSAKQFSYDNDLNSANSCLVLTSPENLANLFNQFNDFSSDQKQLLIISKAISIIYQGGQWNLKKKFQGLSKTFPVISSNFPE